MSLIMRVILVLFFIGHVMSVELPKVTTVNYCSQKCRL